MTSEADGSPRGRPPLAGRSRVLLLGGLVVLVALTVQRFFLAPVGPAVREFSGTTMGTTYTIKFVTAGRASPGELAAVRDTVRGRLDEVNRLMSTYDSTSELSRFNRAGTTGPLALSPLTVRVIRIAQEVSEASGGAFDVTVGPLVDSWGFGPDGRPDRVPDARELEQLAARVGYEKLSVDPDARTVTRAHPGLEVDLSGVAKGFAVDRLAEALGRLGYDAFLVEVGGELKARGSKPGGDAWRVAVEAPDPSSRTIYRVIDLVDRAIATSGDYRNFYEQDGTRYSHLIDPRTGRSTTYAGASVSVVDTSAAVADAWATALTVLGPREGPEVAERENIAALFVVRTNGAFETIATGSFPEPGMPGRAEAER